MDQFGETTCLHTILMITHGNKYSLLAISPSHAADILWSSMRAGSSFLEGMIVK